MYRNLVVRMATVPLGIGLLLMLVCLVGAWQIGRMQAALANMLKENVPSLKAAKQMMVTLRQLRFHSFLYLIDPNPAGLRVFREDEKAFAQALDQALQASYTPQERDGLLELEKHFDLYHQEIQGLFAEVDKGKPRRDFRALAATHPIHHLLEHCQDYFQLNETIMEKISADNDQVARKVRLILIILALAGPLGGLLAGYSMSRSLHHSIHRLNVHVLDIVNHLERKAGLVHLVAGGDLESLDRQLEVVIHRVQQVAEDIRRHQWELMRAEQLASLGRLAAGVAH